MDKGIEHWKSSYTAEGRVTSEISLAPSPKGECLHTPFPSNYTPRCSREDVQETCTKLSIAELYRYLDKWNCHICK